MADHPTTIDGMADEQEAELRRLVEAKGPDWSLVVDPEAGGGCLVEVRQDDRRVRHWFHRDRLNAVGDALNDLRQSPL